MERLRTEEASKALLDGVEEMVQNAMYATTRAETEKLEETLGRHMAVFQMNGEPLGRADLVQHKIEERDASPRKRKLRRLPLLMRKEMSKQVAQMSKDGLIGQSMSPWESSVVLVLNIKYITVVSNI